MDALNALQKHIKIEKLLEHYQFERISNNGGMIRACCKIHGGDNPTGFVANPDNGLWYCHTSDCGGGDIYTLVEKMEGITFREAVQWVADFFNVDIKDMEIHERVESYMKELQRFTKIMMSRKKEELPPYEIPVPLREVTKFRQFKEETLRKFELGYAERYPCLKRDNTPYELTNRLVFPIRQNGKIVGVSLRRVRANDYPKWSHQPVNIETNVLLYNYDNVQGAQTIVVCEGITDVWAFDEIGVPAVATFGAHITDEQYKKLMRTGADLVFAYDGDKAGRHVLDVAVHGYTNKKGQFIRGLFKDKVNCYAIYFNEGEDPENIDRNELKLKYERRMRLC